MRDDELAVSDFNLGPLVRHEPDLLEPTVRGFEPGDGRWGDAIAAGALLSLATAPGLPSGGTPLGAVGG